MDHRTTRAKYLGGALAALTAIAGSVPAEAGLLRLRLEDAGTGNGVVITDNGAGDINPLLGALTISQNLGAGFIVNVVTGISQPITANQLHLNSVNVDVQGAGILRMTLEDPDYELSQPGAWAIAQVGGVLTAPAGSTATFQSWVNASNLVPDLGADQLAAAPLAALGATPAGSVALFDPVFVADPGAFAATDGAAFAISGPFSLFAQAVIRFTGAGLVSFDQDIRVPEPGTLGLISLGMLGLGASLVRRQAVKA